MENKTKQSYTCTSNLLVSPDQSPFYTNVFQSGSTHPFPGHQHKTCSHTDPHFLRKSACFRIKGPWMTQNGGILCPSYEKDLPKKSWLKKLVETRKDLFLKSKTFQRTFIFSSLRSLLTWPYTHSTVDICLNNTMLDVKFCFHILIKMELN